MPKYMAISLCGICCPFNVTAGQVSRFKEMVIWVDLFSLPLCATVLTTFLTDLGGVEGLLKQ